MTFVHFYEDSEKDPPLYQQIKNDGLPFTQVLFLADDKCVAMGHELNPHLYSANGEGIWALETTLDNSGGGDGAKKKSNTQFGKAMSMWGGKKLRSSSDASGASKDEVRLGKGGEGVRGDEPIEHDETTRDRHRRRRDAEMNSKTNPPTPTGEDQARQANL